MEEGIKLPQLYTSTLLRRNLLDVEEEEKEEEGEGRRSQERKGGSPHTTWEGLALWGTALDEGTLQGARTSHPGTQVGAPGRKPIRKGSHQNDKGFTHVPLGSLEPGTFTLKIAPSRLRSQGQATRKSSPAKLPRG